MEPDAARKEPPFPKLLELQRILLFTFLAAVYIATAFPSIPGGDSGEILAEACHLGIAHPPGYPLFTLLYHALEWFDSSSFEPPSPPSLASCPLSVPPGPIAWKANVLGSLFGSGAATILAYTADVWTAGLLAYCPEAAATAAVAWALSPVTWEHSAGVEVFSVNNFLLACCLCFAVRTARRPSKMSACVLAFFSGLALSNQHTSLLTILPLALFVTLLLWRRNLLTWRALAWLSISSLLGLSPYLYLPLASSILPPRPGSWGGSLGSFDAFLRHVLRKEYGTFSLGVGGASEGIEGGIPRIVSYLQHTCNDIGVWVLPLSLVGIVWFNRRAMVRSNCRQQTKKAAGYKSYTKGRRKAKPAGGDDGAGSESSRGLPWQEKVGLLISLSWLFYVLVWHCQLSNLPLHDAMAYAVHARFWMQPDMLLMLLAAAGLGLLVNQSAEFIAARLDNAVSSPSPAAVVCDELRNRHNIYRRALAYLVLAAGLGHGLKRWSRMNKRGGVGDGWTMHRYGFVLLSSLPPEAVLLSHTDLDLNPTRYLRVCEGIRPDVTHISAQMMAYPWWGTTSDSMTRNTVAEGLRPTQADLHAPVIFPQRLRGISTERRSEGNALLITRFLAANMQIPSARPLFLDMQAIDESHISGLQYRNSFILLPWGLVYKVLPLLDVFQVKDHIAGSLEQLQVLQGCLPQPSQDVCPKGSWEFAAGSVLWDAHYQTGLFLLSFAIELSPHLGNRPSEFGTYLQSLRHSHVILTATLKAVDETHAFSGSRSDLLKNTMLAAVRLQQALMVGMRLEGQLTMPKNQTLPTRSEEEATRDSSLALIRRYLVQNPQEKDAPSFIQMYNKLMEGDTSAPT